MWVSHVTQPHSHYYLQSPRICTVSPTYYFLAHVNRGRKCLWSSKSESSLLTCELAVLAKNKSVRVVNWKHKYQSPPSLLPSLLPSDINHPAFINYWTKISPTVIFILALSGSSRQLFPLPEILTFHFRQSGESQMRSVDKSWLSADLLTARQ